MNKPAMILPPKQAAHYAQLAREGKADEKIGDNIYVFNVGGQVITMVSIEETAPSGTVRRK